MTDPLLSLNPLSMIISNAISKLYDIFKDEYKKNRKTVSLRKLFHRALKETINKIAEQKNITGDEYKQIEYVMNIALTNENLYKNFDQYQEGLGTYLESLLKQTSLTIHLINKDDFDLFEKVLIENIRKHFPVEYHYFQQERIDQTTQRIDQTTQIMNQSIQILNQNIQEISKKIDDQSGKLNSKPPSSDKVFKVPVNTNWLNSNQELPICLAQPALVKPDAIANDISRPESVALAEEILTRRDGQSQLGLWFKRENGLLLFPEYAFGSSDFEKLNSLVDSYAYPLIMIAGFGAVRGDKIHDLLSKCEATWPDGKKMIDPQAHYNASWCWIHFDNNTCCYIFLKNFFEQQVEISLVVGLTRGTHILQIEMNDLVIYPLICADLICDQPNSARKRISNAISHSEDGEFDKNKRVLVVALLYTDKPYHELWRRAINEVVSFSDNKTVLCTLNQLAVSADADPEKDKWRCLSGSFIDRHIMHDGPKIPLPPVRYVRTDNASGLIIRHSCVGVSCGNLGWVSSADQGRNVWYPHIQRAFEKGKLHQINEKVDCQELKRYIRRRKRIICHEYDQSVESMIMKGLNQIINEKKEEYLTPRLWAKLLTGIEDKPKLNPDVESIDEVSNSIDIALVAFAALQQVTDASPHTGPSYCGQLIWQEREIMIWKSPYHKWRELISLLERNALDHPERSRLIVFGSDRNGMDCPAKAIIPNRRTDFTIDCEPNPSATGVKPGRIIWQPLGDIVNILNDPTTKLEQKQADILQKLKEDLL